MKDGGQKIASKKDHEATSDKAIRFAAETIIENALNMHATDVHIEPRDGSTLVRLRIHGILNTVNKLPAEISPKLVKYFKKIANLSLKEKNFSQTGNYDHGGAKIRVSVSPTFSGEKITLRLIRARTSLRSLDEIGLWGDNLRQVRQSLRQPNGIIFTVGEGKNTTNFALIGELNSDEKNIVTVENSIEKTLSGINQTEIKPKIGLDFYEAFQGALNQNPDVVLINDITDLKTAQLAFDASMRGKLIIASLPVRHACEVVPFLANLGINPFLISANILTIIEQSLVRTTPTAALISTSISKADSQTILKDFKISAGQLHKLEILAQKNKIGKNKLSTSENQILSINHTKSNSGTNFIGTTGIYEVISFINEKYSSDLQSFIMSSPSAAQISHFLKKEKVASIKVDGLVKSLRAIIPIEEVIRKTGL